MMPCFHFAFFIRMLWASCIFLIIRLIWSNTEVFEPNLLANNDLHLACLNWIQTRELPHVFSGLFCGSTEIEQNTLNIFQRTGLYHLLVVSGAHLIFLEKLLNKILKKRDFVKLSVFLIFSITCQLNPPILRALISQFIKIVSSKKFLFINEETRILLAGIWCLILFPQWVHSTSLMLSWIASLALNYNINNWKKHIMIGIYLIPWTMSFQISTLFNNLVFSSVFEFVIFPFSFLCFLLPGTSSLANSFWNCVEIAIKQLPESSSLISTKNSIEFWPYIFLIHLFHRIKR